MSILVTGAAGFVGNNTVRRLVELGKPVRAMVHNKQKATIRLGDIIGKIELVEGDVTDREGIKPLFRDVSAVVHTAAIALERGGRTYETVNFQGTVNVADAAKEAGVRRFIYISQNGADASAPYRFLASKGKGEDYVMQSGMAATALRPSAIFGLQDEFFNTFARLVKLTPLIFPLIGGGEALFQPVSVDDVVAAIVKALEDDATVGQRLGLGGLEVLTLEEIERRVLQALNAKRALVAVPVGLLRLPVFLMEKLLPGAPVNRNLLDLLAVPNVVADNALPQLGIEPKPFNGEHIAYLRHNSAGQALRKFFTNATVN